MLSSIQQARENGSDDENEHTHQRKANPLQSTQMGGNLCRDLSCPISAIAAEGIDTGARDKTPITGEQTRKEINWNWKNIVKLKVNAKSYKKGKPASGNDEMMRVK